MRLTLRTLLAYLDDILEPSDAQEIGKKVEESEFANGLVHRIRGCTRRLRLAAPKLEGKGMGLDSNTVAEYLDNTLPPDRVADFEKVCLESDVHLAEVAACHQILTLVLGEPAHVEPATRERMYRIAGDVGGAQVGIDQAHAATATAPDATVVSEARSKRKRKKTEVPDYLREGSRMRLWSIAATVLLAAVLTGVGLRAIGPFDSNHHVLGFMFSDRGETVVQNSTPVPPGGQLATVPPQVVLGTVVPDATPDALDVGIDVPDPDGGASSPDASPPVDPPEPDGVPVQTPDEPADGGLPEEPSEHTTPRPSIPGDEQVALVDTQDPVPAEDSDAEQGEQPQPGAEPQAVDLGRYISEQQVLARWDDESSAWFRLEPRTALFGGDRLLVLPTFRPQILLADGVQLTLDGPASVELAASPEGTPQVKINYGRVLLMTVGKAEAQVGLVTGVRQSVVTFDDAESALAVDVRRFHSEGMDPRLQDPHIRVRLIATSGRIQWHPEDGDPQAVEAGQMMTLVNDESEQIQDAGELPAWIRTAEMTSIDRLASTALQPMLPFDRPLSLSLSELAEHRRAELRSLAVRCLAYIGQYDTFVSVLNDVGQRSSWSVQFDVLRQATAISPAAAEQIADTLAKHRGEDSERLFRLLWGYSPDELADGFARELVEYLDHSKMDFRVLAFENLRRITGVTLLYRPGNSQARRRSTVQRWREKLRAELIVYKNLPSKLPESEADKEPAGDNGG